MVETTYQKLSEYIRKKMRMSHIYQPVMIRELLLQGGTANIEAIARSLLVHDRSQIEYYALRTKNMVGKVLTANGVTEVQKKGRSVEGYALNGAKDLSSTDTEELIRECDKAIEAFMEQRGDRIWSHRSSSAGYVSGTLRYEVLKRAKFRCELCGTSAEVKALEVDHILPRNLGGTDDESNLQALCYSCNAMKRDRDDTDFRGLSQLYDQREVGCIFCDLPGDRVILENELAVCIQDGYPVTEGHSLIIPKRHVADYFELFQLELNAIQSLMRIRKLEISNGDPDVQGFNVGINTGEVAGQTVFHCHVHLIPRREGDVDNPRGGVRGVIPEKRAY